MTFFLLCRFHLFAFITTLLFAPLTALAGHPWSDYHWGRTGEHPFILKLGDNVPGSWDASLEGASYGWNYSSVLETMVVEGNTSAKRCRATSGWVEICAARYGYNGWLGIAQIWISGSLITQGVVKMNNSYFNTSTYDTVSWRNMVMCQEVGHTFGLGHQDENFDNDNLDTCMDYTNDPKSNQLPNTHDFELLAQIYADYDNEDTFDFSTGDPVEEEPPTCKGGWKKCGNRARSPSINELVLNETQQWGKLTAMTRNGRQAVYDLDLGDGNRIRTHVFWAD